MKRTLPVEKTARDGPHTATGEIYSAGFVIGERAEPVLVIRALDEETILHEPVILRN